MRGRWPDLEVDDCAVTELGLFTRNKLNLLKVGHDRESGQQARNCVVGVTCSPRSRSRAGRRELEWTTSSSWSKRAVAVARLGACADKLCSQTSSGVRARTRAARDPTRSASTGPSSVRSRAPLCPQRARPAAAAGSEPGRESPRAQPASAPVRAGETLTLPCALSRSTEIIRLTSTSPPITVAATAGGTGGRSAGDRLSGRRLTARIRQSSIPRPIAVASEPTCSASLIFLPTLTRVSGSPGRTLTPIRV